MSEPTGEIGLPQEVVLENQSNRILGIVGLTLPDLEGKAILDVGAGKRYLEQQVKKSGINATVTSLDNHEESLLAGGELNENVIIADIEDEGLPFPDNSFDLIVNVGGPIKGGPADDDSVRKYIEAVRVLKPGGALRTSAPFAYAGGLGDYFYDWAKNDFIDVDQEIIAHYEESPAYQDEPLVVDDEGVPVNENFWLFYSGLYPKDEQATVWSTIADDLRGVIQENGYAVSVDVNERATGELYTPYVVLKKGEE